LAIPSISAAGEAFPGDWKGPTSTFKISVNGDPRDASVALLASGLQITYLGISTYTSLDITLKLGPHYTLPRKLSKSFLFSVTKLSGTNAVSSLSTYPEISGSCPAGHSLNSATKVCNRCNNFRYNDGSMSECKICPGQGIGNLYAKATKCVSFCTWPFEYMYDDGGFSGSCLKDGGLCTKFVSETEDTECICNAYGFDNNYNPLLSGSSSSSSKCTFVNVNANVTAVVIVFSFFITIFIACVFTLPSKPDSTLKQRLRLKSNLLFLALFPTLDFLSDLVYILTSKFHRIEVFSASVFFFVFPM
jgi:hypothetical protein